MNKPVYIGLTKLEISKTKMYEFWYGHVKPKYKETGKLCYMETDNIIVHIKAEDISVDIVKDVETSFDTANKELEAPLPKGKN